MASIVDVSATRVIAAPPERVRSIMFNPRKDPSWMAAVRQVDAPTDDLRPGVRVGRIGRFLGRTLRWTTVVTGVTTGTLDLEIVDGPMRGTVTYRIAPAANGSRVSIQNIGSAPGFATRWLISYAMRRSLTADLRRLADLAERRS